MLLAQRDVRRRSARGFTMVEMAVVLVLITLLLSFALPKLVGASSYAQDTKAQITASTALDSMLAVYAAGAGAADTPECPALQPSRYSDPASDPASNYPLRLSGNCPQMANPVYLRKVNPEILYSGTINDPAGAIMNNALCPGGANDITNTNNFTSGSMISSSDMTAADPVNPSKPATPGTATYYPTSGNHRSECTDQASVAAVWNSTTKAWKLLVAVRGLNPSTSVGRDSVSTCWMAVRQVPTADSNADATERYFAWTNTRNNANGCGAYVSTNNPPVGTYYMSTATVNADGSSCDAPANGAAPYGRSWSRPCTIYQG